MPSYELTEQHSHRHPFLGESEGERVQDGDQNLFDEYGVEHGDGVFADQNSIFQNGFDGEYMPLLDADPEVEAAKIYLDSPTSELGFGVDKSTAPVTSTTSTAGTDPVKLVTPLVTGLLRAAVSYGVLRTFKVDKKSARKVAITLGILETVGALAGNWLRDKVGDLPATATTKAAVPKASK